MASKVQLNLEKRLGELRDLERKGIFTPLELQEVVRRRTRHETACVRQGTQYKDFLEYIEYENKLESLRVMRSRRMKQKEPTTVSDYSIPRGILNLYARATRRFPNSKELWRHYIAYTLDGPSPKAVSAALTGAIAAHPAQAEFWVLAARWEADGSNGRGGGNIDGARKLIMRGLRFNPADATLWLEWLRIEVGFAERMRARWSTLGLLATVDEAPKPADEIVQMDTDVQENAMPVEEAIEAENNDDVQGRRALVDGALARIVVENAFSSNAPPTFASNALDLLHTLPDDSKLRLALIDLIYTHLSPLTDPTSLVLRAAKPLYLLPSSSSALTLVETTASVIANLTTLFSSTPATQEAIFIYLVKLDRNAEVELGSYISAQLGRLWRYALKSSTVTPSLARLRLQQLREDDGQEASSEAIREAERILRPEWRAGMDIEELRKRSESADAVMEDHLALLKVMLGAGKEASMVPMVLKRIQARVGKEAAAELEARWVLAMSEIV